MLIDNAAAPGLASEHGLALWIEAHGLRVLFDAGQSAACLENARALGICTGEAAVHELQAAFPGRVTPGYAGLRYAANAKGSK